MILPPRVEELVASLMRRIEALEAENAELRRRLDLDSSNSSKPPSSDGLKKKPRGLRGLRTRTGKPSGGQKGHRGDTLRQIAEPDRIVEHAAERCAHCRARLLADSKAGDEKRQVFDLPEKPLIVTEHRAAIHDCPACGRRTRAAFPEGVVSPAQYGERVKAAGVYLNAQQLGPEERTAQVLQDLFGAAACGATVAGWVRCKAEALAPVYRSIGECVAAAPVRRLDETGFRIAGRPVGCTPPRRQPTPSIAPTSPAGRARVAGRRRGPRPLARLLEPRNRRSRVLQRPSPARTSGGLRTRQGALGRGPARDASGRQRGRAKCQSAGDPALAPETIKGFEDRYWAAGGGKDKGPNSCLPPRRRSRERERAGPTAMRVAAPAAARAMRIRSA